MLSRIADGIEECLVDLARLLASENGKPIGQTREEIRAAIRIFRGFGEEAKRIFGRQIPLDAVPGLERHLAITIREPVGVVPVQPPRRAVRAQAAAALAAGNAVIVKAPEKCPLTLLEIAGIVAGTGCPPGAHTMVIGGPEAANSWPPARMSN